MGIDGVYIEGKSVRPQEPERVYVTLVYFALLSLQEGQLICIILIEMCLNVINRTTEQINGK